MAVDDTSFAELKQTAYETTSRAFAEIIDSLPDDEKAHIARTLADDFGYNFTSVKRWLSGATLPETRTSHAVLMWLKGYMAHRAKNTGTESRPPA